MNFNFKIIDKMGDKFSSSRKTGKDKVKDRYNRFGKYTSKSVRLKEQRLENSNKKSN